MHERWVVDLRALAALRIGLGAVLLLDLVMRAPDLSAFYSDDGVLPRAAAREAFWLAAASLHMRSGAVGVQAFLFLIAGLAALALLVGWRTRLATFLSAGLLASLHARNPFILNAGDLLLLFLVAWGVFLPLGARWSLDAPRAGHAADADDAASRGHGEAGAVGASGGHAANVANVATIGLLAQPVIVYMANAVYKTKRGQWLKPGVLDHVFMDPWTVPLGNLVGQVPGLPDLVARSWFLLVLASPMLLVLHGRPRAWLAALFMAGHVGMLLTLRLGVFPIVSVLALLPMLPAPFWDRVAARLPARPAWTDRWARPCPARLRPHEAGIRRAAMALAGLALAANLVWTAADVGVPAPGPLEDAVATTNGWTMFARPPTEQKWVAAPATLTSGEVVDALYGEEPDGPEHVRPWPDARWRKYLGALSREGDVLLPALAGHLCGQGPADDPVAHVRIQRVERAVDQVTVVVLYETDCG